MVSCHLERGFCRNRGGGEHPGQAPRWRACPRQSVTQASQCWTQAERCSVSHPLGNEPVFVFLRGRLTESIFLRLDYIQSGSFLDGFLEFVLVPFLCLEELNDSSRLRDIFSIIIFQFVLV